MSRKEVKDEFQPEVSYEKTFYFFLIGVFAVSLLTGCSEQTRARWQSRQAQPEPQPAVKEPAPVVAPAPVLSRGPNHVVRTYDCSCCGAIKLEKLMPEKVQLNQPFEYTITATNLTDMMLHQVVVKENLPDGFKYQRSTPAGKLDGRTLSWTMDSLGPKASEKIVVVGTAERVGTIQTCADATYIIPACAQTEVVQPALALVKTAPERVLICDNIPLQFTVTNKGTGTATNVKLSDRLPEGLKTADGRTSIDLTLGNLAPGQSVSRTVIVRADKTGSYTNTATAVADGDLKAESGETRTVVAQPILTVEKTGPERNWLGRTISYDIVVTNKGNAPATETVVTDTIPANVEQVQVSHNGQVAAGRITWNLGTLAPDASRKLTVSYRPTSAGNYRNEARATAVCAEAVAAAAATRIEGIPAVLLEVIDLEDPIEVGRNETYVIVVTNQGSAPDTNIRIQAYLEDSMEYVSNSGATRGSYANGVVTFEPLASLAPGAKAEWRVVVKAVEADDARFRVVMNTGELQREVMETEATRFYE